MLVFPPVITPAPEDVPKNTQMPMGLAYIAGVLENNGYNIKILDAFTAGDAGRGNGSIGKYHGLSPNNIRKEIEGFGPHIVGISSMYTMYAEGAHVVADIAKKVSRDILVVCGGAHASVNSAKVLEDKNIDIVVKGEGELTFLEMAREFENSKDIYALEGVIYRKNGQICENPPRPLIKNLDDLPFPARHLLPMRQYFDNALVTRNYVMRHPPATLITSRGCPGGCIYCCVKKVFGRTWRGRSAENVADEIEFLTKNYGVREIHFVDDSISVDMKRLYKICQEIIRRRIDVKWAPPAGIAIWLLNKELLKIMRQSGCYRLTFGLESGNEETLRFIGKRYSFAQAKEIIREANRLGIWISATFIIGFPHETRERVLETISFALGCALDFVVFYTPVIFPGTPLFDVFMREGIDYNPEITGINKAYSTRHLAEEEIFKLRRDANYRFLFSRALRPYRLIRKVRNREDFLYLIKIISNITHSCISSVYNKKSAFGLLRESRLKEDP